MKIRALLTLLIWALTALLTLLIWALTAPAWAQMSGGAVPDEVPVSGSVSAAGVLFTQDMTGYNSITVEVTANASGNTVTFQASDDNSNWVSTAVYPVGNLGSIAAIATTATTTPNIYRAAKSGRYFRANVTSYIGGTTTVVGNLHVSPANVALSAASTGQASTAAIGKVGPGYTSAQTPIIGVGAGTTAAVTGTLAAQASKSTYICGFDITANATAATSGNATITGVSGGALTFGETVAINTAGFAVLSKTFTPCLISSAVNTAIVVTSFAAGTGGVTNVNAYGYQE